LNFLQATFILSSSNELAEKNLNISFSAPSLVNSLIKTSISSSSSYSSIELSCSPFIFKFISYACP